MRSFEFTAKNIGDERYLTYTMGEGCELDEDTLDYCEEHDVAELIRIIFEQDDDYDYLTYDISGKVSLQDFMKKTLEKEEVLKILRNVALGLISCKEQAIHLSYLLLNRSFLYIDPDTLGVQFLCVPVESSGSLSVEFKGFVRQFLANSAYDVEEDLSYVGQLLTYINGDSFNLRGLIGLTEALMQDAGIAYEKEEEIKVEGSDEEVVEPAAPEDTAESEETEETSGKTDEEKISDLMKDLGGEDSDTKLPEIGDDEEDDLPGEEEVPEQTAETEEAEAEPDKEKANTAEPETAESDAAEPDTAESAAEEADAAETVAEVTTEPGETAEKEEAAPQQEEDLGIELETVEQPDREKAPDAEPEPEEIREEKTAKPAEQPAGQERIRSAAEAAQDAEIHTAAPHKAESMDEIKARLEQLMNGGTSTEKQHVYMQKPVKVNRAAMIKNAEKMEVQEEEAKAAAAEKQAKSEVSSQPVKEEGKEPSEAPAPAEKEKEAPAAQTEQAAAPQSDGSEASSDTEPRQVRNAGIVPKGATSVNNTILGNSGTLRINPYLIRVNTKERIIINKPVFKIGRASRGVDYHVGGNDRNISRQHAIILHKGDSYYIKDNKSTNHTFVDDVRVEDGEEKLLADNCTIRLGDEEFTFRIQ